MINIEDLTLKQIREIQEMAGELNCQPKPTNSFGQCLMGKKVIIRTYSAGVWFGTLAEKDGTEVILHDARRMWRWWAAESISLSGVAKYGIKPHKSKIAPAVKIQWLDAIEITPCEPAAAETIEGAEDAEAE